MENLSNLSGDIMRQRFGINPLTGEAEGIWGLGRMLYDLAYSAAKAWEEFLGGNVIVRRAGELYVPYAHCRGCGGTADLTVTEGSNWNSKVGAVPAVASVMATDAMLVDFVIFCLAREGKIVKVPYKDGLRQGLWAFDDQAEAAEKWPLVKEAYGYDNTRSVSCGGTAGTRNRHEMSGRVV